MMLTCSVKVERKGDMAAFLRRVVAATRGRHEVKMGMVPGQIAPNVLAYGWYNHQGTSRGIPSRPFVRVGFHRAQSTMRTSIRASLRGALFARSTFAQSLPQLGQLGVIAIQSAIDSGIGPANKPSTVKKKGHGLTLRDTYTLRGSITYRIG